MKSTHTGDDETAPWGDQSSPALKTRPSDRRAFPHSAEVMVVVTIWRKGKLKRKTVAFAHDCGEAALEVIEHGVQPLLFEDPT